MPSLNFTIFVGKIEDGTKRQTIRLARKRPVKVGDYLYFFTGMRTKKCRKLYVPPGGQYKVDGSMLWITSGNPPSTIGMPLAFVPLSMFTHSVPCAESLRLPWREIAEGEYWRRDGFDDFEDFMAWFEQTHNPMPDAMFDILRW